MLEQPSLELRTTETEIDLLKYRILEAETKGWKFDRIIFTEYLLGDLDDLLLVNKDYLDQLHKQGYRFSLFHALDSEGKIIPLNLMAALYIKKD